MKTRIARISLAVAVTLFFTGFLVLCNCPGWYALAATFAAVSAWLGSQRTRFWGVILVAGSLVLAAGHTYGKLREREQMREIRRRYEEKQARDRVRPPDPAKQ